MDKNKLQSVESSADLWTALEILTLSFADMLSWEGHAVNTKCMLRWTTEFRARSPELEQEPAGSITHA